MQTNKAAEIIDLPEGITVNAINNFLDMGIATVKYSDYAKMLPQLLSEHETIIVLLRKNIDAYDEKMDNAGTIVFLTQLMRQHEDIAGILRRCMNKTIMN